MKNCKDFILKEKFSSKKIFLLESILNNLTADSKKNPQNLYKSEEPVKKKDFKTEIEARFFKAKNSKYIFPKQILVAEADENSSLDSLKNLGVYDLNLQNQKKNQESDNISTKKLIKNIQKIKIYEKKEDFCETLQKMKKSLQEKLKKQLYDKKYNNFVDENEIRYNDNKNSNASDRLEYKSNRKKTMPKNLRTSFSNLHSNFNHSLQQNAQNLDAFAKQNMCPTKINSKKSHMINFLELYNEKKNFISSNIIGKPKESEKDKKDDLLKIIKAENSFYGLVAKNLYRKKQENIINQNKKLNNQQKEILSFKNPSSDISQKVINKKKFHNLTERNKDSLVTSTYKLNEVNDFFHKINKKVSSVNRRKVIIPKNVIKKEIKGLSNNPSFNSSSSVSSQRFLNTPLNMNIKDF